MRLAGAATRLLFMVVTGAAFAAPTGEVRADFTPVAGWDRQLFPSFIVATATAQGKVQSTDVQPADDVLGGGRGLLGVTVTAPSGGAPVKVTITSDAILEPSTFVGVLLEGGRAYTIFPNIKFKYDALLQNKQAVPVDVTYRVEVAGGPAEDKTETLTLRSINDCPRIIVEGDRVKDVRFMFAAYVNEEHPFVDKVLREALDGGIVNSFTGYQSGDSDDVYSQVYALWKAVSSRDLRYSNITATAAVSDKVHSQHVRLIDESINNAQANCVDGSVLFASLLRKVGIEPYLVLIPGHCYVAFQVDKDGEEIVALETTLIGASLDGDAQEIDDLSDVVDDDEKEQASWTTFCAAFAAGRADLEKNAEKFKDEKEHYYAMIPIADARRRGILPIAFKSGAVFAPAPVAGTSDDDADSTP